MSDNVYRIIGKFLFGYWLLISVVGFLTSGSIINRFGFGVIFWWIGLGALGLSSIAMLLALRSKRHTADFLRFITGIVTAIAALVSLIIYLGIHPDVYSPAFNNPNQIVMMGTGFLLTTVYCWWNNEVVRPMSIRELREGLKDEYDPTRIDRGLNDRIFAKRDVDRDSEDTVVIPITGGNLRVDR